MNEITEHDRELLLRLGLEESEEGVGILRRLQAQREPETVMLPEGARPGVKRCGPYVPGREYEVDAVEAYRLVKAKGFVYVADGSSQPNEAPVMADIPEPAEEG